MRILLDNKIKYHIVSIDANGFLILYLICEIAVFSMVVFVHAYLIGHYWNARIFRNMLIGNHFKIKSSHGSDSESGEENDSSTPSGFRRFGVNYIYIFIEHAVMIVYGLLCCMVSCRDCPF